MIRILIALFMSFWAFYAVAQPMPSEDGVDIHQRARKIENNISIHRRDIIQNNIYVLPPRIEDQSEVVLKQDLVLRGDFTSWHHDLSEFRLVIRRRGPEFSCWLVEEFDKPTEKASSVFSFTTAMMQKGVVYHGKRFRVSKGLYEVMVQLADADIEGPAPRFEVHALSFRVLILKRDSSDNDTSSYDKTPIVVEQNAEYIQSPLGQFRIDIEEEGAYVRIDRCLGTDYRSYKTVAKLSRDRLEKAIEKGTEIEVSEGDDWIIFTIQHIELNDDGKIQQVELDIFKSSSL